MSIHDANVRGFGDPNRRVSAFQAGEQSFYRAHSDIGLTEENYGLPLRFDVPVENRFLPRPGTDGKGQYGDLASLRKAIDADDSWKLSSAGRGPVRREVYTDFEVGPKNFALEPQRRVLVPPNPQPTLYDRSRESHNLMTLEAERVHGRDHHPDISGLPTPKARVSDLIHHPKAEGLIEPLIVPYNKDLVRPWGGTAGYDPGDDIYSSDRNNETLRRYIPVNTFDKVKHGEPESKAIRNKKSMNLYTSQADPSMPGSHRYTLREQVVMASDPTIDVHTRQTPAADRTPASRSIDRDRTENRPYLVLDGAGGRSSTIDRDRDLARLKERAASVPSSVIDVEGAGIDFEPKDREGGLRAFLDRRKVGRNFGYSSLDVVPRDTDPEQNSRDIRGVAAKTRASPFEPAPWRSDVRQATRFSNQEPTYRGEARHASERQHAPVHELGVEDGIEIRGEERKAIIRDRVAMKERLRVQLSRTGAISIDNRDPFSDELLKRHGAADRSVIRPREEATAKMSLSRREDVTVRDRAIRLSERLPRIISHGENSKSTITLDDRREGYELKRVTTRALDRNRAGLALGFAHMPTTGDALIGTGRGKEKKRVPRIVEENKSANPDPTKTRAPEPLSRDGRLSDY